MPEEARMFVKGFGFRVLQVRNLLKMVEASKYNLFTTTFDPGLRSSFHHIHSPRSMMRQFELSLYNIKIIVSRATHVLMHY
jgi:hypothetical protein